MTAAVTIRLPALLAELIDGSAAVAVSGATVGEALEALFVLHPQLRVHILDESGAVRPHVSCFHGGLRLVGMDGNDRRLADVDEITIIHAVSGG